MKKFKKVVMGVLTIAVTLGATFGINSREVDAYNLFGGRYTQDIYNKKYYNDPTLVTGIDVKARTDNAVTSWNNTQNTRVWWQKTTTRSESILDFVGSLYESGVKGRTYHYSGSTHVNPDTQNWYWVTVAMNTDEAEFAKDSPYYTNDDDLYYQTVVAHEMGHAMSLMHNNYVWNEDTLMYPSVNVYFEEYGLYYPDADAENGVRAAYGTLN